MIRRSASLIAFLALVPVQPRATAGSGPAEATLPNAGNPAGLPQQRPTIDWDDRRPVLRALNPEEARRQSQAPARPSRRVVRYREAILPDPPNGLVLVDSLRAEQTPEWSVPVPKSSGSRPLRAHELWRVGPNFMVPVARGH